MSSSTTLTKALFTVTAAVTLSAAAFGLISVYDAVQKRGGWSVEMARLHTYITPNDTTVHLTLVQTEIEAHQYDQALVDARRFCSISSTVAGCPLTLGAILSLTGNASDLSDLIARQTNTETRRALQNLLTSKLTQAQELLLLGLVQSSQRVVTTIYDQSIPLSLLKARIQLVSSRGHTRFERSFIYIDQALQLDPTNIEALDLAISVSRQTSNSERTHILVSKRSLIPLIQ